MIIPIINIRIGKSKGVLRPSWPVVLYLTSRGTKTISQLSQRGGVPKSMEEYINTAKKGCSAKMIFLRIDISAILGFDISPPEK
ncbi:MAG: hypothetical protein DDT40_01796 [candidate division WS2 bacterium]|nr:hypothetical protein [Candidatus Psychracetigena formicireducens]